MTIWPPSKDSLKRPAYRSLAQSLIDAIEAGEIEPGARLPTHRALAYELGVSVQTVSRAYDELSRLGVIAGEVGRGSFVRTGPLDERMPWHKTRRSEEIIDCSMLVPVTGELHRERFEATLAGLARDVSAETIFSFRPRATLEAHCEKALSWLARCGLRPSADQVLPTNGSTSAMTVALMTAALPGETVATEEVGHHTLKSLTNALGMRLLGLPVDEEGVTPDSFERACRAGAVKALFVLPNALNPHVAMMGVERRARLAEISRRFGVFIIENDAWGPLDPERPPPIAALAPERTFYFTGLTKCLLPGLRIGWLVAPENMVAAVRTRHLVTSWMATPLIAEIATRWIDEGVAAELLLWQREQVRRRNMLVGQILGDAAHRATPYGLHVWMPLPPPWTEENFVAHARHDGVAFASGANFTIGETPQPPAIRICLGAGNEEAIAKGLSVAARLARSAPEPALLAI